MPLTIITLLEYISPSSPSRSPGTRTLTLPVPPAQLTVTRGQRVETVQLAALGEVDFSQGARVTEVRFSALFPAVYDPSYCVISPLPDPLTVDAALGRWARNDIPVRVVVSQLPINLLCRLTELETTHKGGEPGDLYAEMTFRAWRDVRAQRTATPAFTRHDPRPKPTIYQTRAGDTLQSVARSVLGNSARADDIYRLNSAVIGKDRTRLPAGTRLRIP